MEVAESEERAAEQFRLMVAVVERSGLKSLVVESQQREWELAAAGPKYSNRVILCSREHSLSKEAECFDWPGFGWPG